ncbi:MAG: hypothetical protein V4655_05120, partial [Bdellovibrionota bacterium]
VLMNQWTWLFKKFPFSNLTIKSRAVIGSSLGVLVILGCQNLMRPASSGTSAKDASNMGAAVIEDKSHIVASIKVFVADAEGKEAYIADFDRTTCVDGLPTLWSTAFSSVFGEHRFDIDYTNLVDKRASVVNVKSGKERFQIAVDGIPQGLSKAGLCDLPFRTEKTTLPVGSESSKELTALLQSVAPDCSFGAAEGGKLSCTIAHGGEGDVRARLDLLTKNMSTKWNHQPYLLIRRLTLTKQLLDASQSADVAKGLHKFCRVIEFSLPHELPLAFRSLSWQSKVCRDKSPNKDLIMIGLDQATREIESLAHRIEDTSLVGTFTLAVPHDKSPVKEYWISLQPMDLPVLDKNDTSAQNPCVWHPIFAEQMDKALIAMDLGQIKSASGKSFCAPIPDLAKAMKDSDHYIRASIASEMEFPIVNGQSKLLRLP